MAVVDQSGIKGKTRDKPISAQLEALLKAAAEATGIDKVFVTSGSQPGTKGKSTGSTRHNKGRAADLQLIDGGKTLRFTDDDGGRFADFITACAALGATGIGAQVSYMGDQTIHVGYGLTESDTLKLVWGRNGKYANAPDWLRKAAKAGWSKLSPSHSESATTNEPTSWSPGAVYRVNARNGLHLRQGPGTEFEITSKLELGTLVYVLAFEGVNRMWAKVSLDPDGLVDGHVHRSFIDKEDGAYGHDEEAEEVFPLQPDEYPD